jgi:TRAP-type C4-dicarboxylate transport system permease small subunit
MDRWERADEIIDRVEQTSLVILLSCMIVIAFLQIVLRNLFSTGLSWGDSLVRNLVLWVSFVGAALATKEGKHINIDVVSRWIPLLGRQMIAFLIQLFSFFICCLLTFAALKFIKNEAQLGSTVFLGIPAWIPEIILPIVFGLMAIRFGFHCLRDFFTILKTGKREFQGGKT